jgi:hypothetical protein
MKMQVLFLTFAISLGAFAQHTQINAFDQQRDNTAEDCLPPIVNNQSVCIGSEAWIELQGNAHSYNWYTSATSSNIAYKGDEQYFDNVTDNVIYYVSSVCNFSQSQQRKLETNYNGNNGKDGIMFDLETNEDITLTGFEINMNEGTSICEVWYRHGSIQMHESDANGWNFLSQTFITGNGSGASTFLDVEDLFLPAGDIHGIYITFRENGWLNYSNVEDQTKFTDGTISIDNAKGIGYPFESICAQRVFNGSVQYSVGDYPESNRIPVMIEAKEKPYTPVVVPQGNSLVSTTSTGNQWYINGEQIVGATSQMYQPSIEGAYSVTTHNGGCSSEMSESMYFGTHTFLDMDELSLSTYPNPVVDELTVDFGTYVESDLEIALLDLNGKVIEVKNALETNTVSFNMQQVPNGHYMIRISNNIDEKLLRVIKGNN